MASYILIAGMPRSGSTLLQSILNRSDGAYTLPETHFFEEAKKINPAMKFTAPQIETLFRVLKTKWNLCADKLENTIEQFKNQPVIDIREVFFRLIDAYKPLGENQLKAAIEKTPGNLIAIESLLEFDPDLKCILTCRNPRDFVNSISNTYWAPDSLDKILNNWKSSLTLIFQLKDKYPGNIKILHYEEMVKSPEIRFREIYEFAGLTWNAEYLNDINCNTDEFILPAEHVWKANNIKLSSIRNNPPELTLSVKQRYKIFYSTLIPMLRIRYLKHYRI